MQKYKVILSDPPWKYRDKCVAGKRGAAFKYPVLTLDQIKALPVPDLAADDSVLFLWSTFPMTREAHEVIDAWGFTFKTIGFLWVKTNRKKRESFAWGMGNWTRSNPEPCLLAVKGKPKRVSAAVHSVIMSPRLKHSRKPAEAYVRIEELLGDVSRIELFARRRRRGWDSWGDELDDSDVELVQDNDDTGIFRWLPGQDARDAHNQAGG
jgi:N6-adenosine-specific RNA methylase IME4